ncbi:hypothetical protein Leryth_009172 [Lithospermum erythrorhizon]|nr:hypothetical protein Leryth_009172 [Lithospermum erythrorhizon]
MAQASKEPCKKEACDIQACLSKNNFMSQKAGAALLLADCAMRVCEKWSIELIILNSGMLIVMPMHSNIWTTNLNAGINESPITANPELRSSLEHLNFNTLRFSSSPGPNNSPCPNWRPRPSSPIDIKFAQIKPRIR